MGVLLLEVNVGHFAYETFRLLDTSPLRGQFAHSMWTQENENVWHTLRSKNKSSAVAEMGDLGHNRHGPKRGRDAVPLSRSAGNPSNTMWPARRSTSVPSVVFIHPAVWPQ